MDLATFKARRAAQALPRFRQLCSNCRKVLATCYCSSLKPFISPVDFVILQHEAEARNAIATARMAHLSVLNSLLFVGRGFAGHEQVDALIADQSRRHVMLFPSPEARPIEEVFADTDPRSLVFWVLDAKWAQVPKMLRLSPNLRQIPMAQFKPTAGSAFRLRRQPAANCLSTIESMHVVIDRYRQCKGQPSTDHQALIEVFQAFVHQQLAFVDPTRPTRHQVAKAMRLARRGPPKI